MRAIKSIYHVLATPLFTVPTARAVGGTDLSLPVGLLVSAGVISF